MPRVLLWPLVWAYHWLLRYQAWETANWITDCERDGILQGVSLNATRGQRDHYRTLAILAQHWLFPIKPALTPTRTAPARAEKGTP